jgi:signal transduction histidine kinase
LTHFDLAGLVSDIATEISARDNQSGMIENSVPRELHIFADRDQLYRVLSNLVLNAFQAGATKVAVTAQADAEMTSIEVADNGPGLPAKVREHLFEPFQGSTRVGGTGLGLAIARDLMRGHGGDAALARSDEDGTTFVLRLPVEEKRERVRFGRTSQTSGTETGPPANAAE